MFKSLELKIKCLITVALAICFIVVSVVSYFSIKRIGFDNFSNLSVKYIMQKNINFELYMKYIEETSKQITMNPQTLEILKEHNADNNFIASLDEMKLSDSNILGVALFWKEGDSITSRNASAYPRLELLRSYASINNFLNSAADCIWLIRDNYTAEHYGYSYFNKKYGVITYITKIYDKAQNILGYLLIDIDIKCIYSFFNSSSIAFCNKIDIYSLSSDGSILPPRPNIIRNEDIIPDIEQKIKLPEPSGCTFSSDRRNLLIFSNPSSSDIKIVSSVPLKDLLVKLNYLVIGSFMITLLLILLSVYIAIRLSRSIIIPLTNLFNKMNKNTV